MKKVQTIGIINTTADAACYADGVHHHLIVDTGTTQEILRPIPKGGRYELIITAPQVERRQIAVIGIDDETIISNERYSIVLYNKMRTREGVHEVESTYSQTSPVVLSGTASTDRNNIYTALTAKVNDRLNNFVTAYVLYKYAFTLGQDAGGSGATAFGDTPANNTVTYGATVTAAGGATATLAYVDITSGTIAGNDAAGYAWVYGISAVATFTGTTTCVSADYYASGVAVTEQIVMTLTAGTLTAGQGMAIVDDAYYYNPAVIPSREGASYVAATQGFQIAEAEIARTPQYLFGLGSDLLLKLPTYGLYGANDFVRGDVELKRYDESKTFSLTVYSEWRIKVTTDAIIDSMANGAVPLEKEYVFYLHNHETTPAGTAWYRAITTEAALLETAIEAALSCTATHVNY